MHPPIRTAALVCAVAFVAATASHAQNSAPAPMSPDTVLADNGIARVTRADYELELTRLPEQVRGGFATSEKRVVDLVNRLLVTKTLAAQADQAKLVEEPETARRLAAEMERIKAQLMLAKVERDAAAAFDANPAPFEARARDLYAMDPRKYEVAGEVSASHILFATPPHSVAEAQRLATEARAQIVAGRIIAAVLSLQGRWRVVGAIGSEGGRDVAVAASTALARRVREQPTAAVC